MNGRGAYANIIFVQSPQFVGFLAAIVGEKFTSRSEALLLQLSLGLVGRSDRSAVRRSDVVRVLVRAPGRALLWWRCSRWSCLRPRLPFPFSDFFFFFSGITGGVE